MQTGTIMFKVTVFTRKQMVNAQFDIALQHCELEVGYL
jgi:hypothetical protein